MLSRVGKVFMNARSETWIAPVLPAPPRAERPVTFTPVRNDGCRVPTERKA